MSISWPSLSWQSHLLLGQTPSAWGRKVRCQARLKRIFPHCKVQFFATSLPGSDSLSPRSKLLMGKPDSYLWNSAWLNSLNKKMNEFAARNTGFSSENHFSHSCSVTIKGLMEREKHLDQFLACHWSQKLADGTVTSWSHLHSRPMCWSTNTFALPR